MLALALQTLVTLWHRHVFPRHTLARVVESFPLDAELFHEHGRFDSGGVKASEFTHLLATQERIRVGIAGFPTAPRTHVFPMRHVFKIVQMVVRPIGVYMIDVVSVRALTKKRPSHQGVNMKDLEPSVAFRERHPAVARRVYLLQDALRLRLANSSMGAYFVMAQAGNSLPFFSLHSAIALIVVIVILGLCLHLIITYVPMAPPIKTLLIVVVVLLIVLFLLRTFALI